MFHKLRRLTLALSLAAIPLAYVTTVLAEPQDRSVYQIVKASESRVWRLNTYTGEIGVCSLVGEQLMCTSSTQALNPPTKTYADLEIERVKLRELDEQRREEKRKRSLATLDLMMNAFKGIAIAGANASN